MCLFRALVLHLHDNQRLENKTLKIFKLFMVRMHGLIRNQFQGVHKDNIPYPEDLLTLILMLYDLDFVDGYVFEEHARLIAQNFETTVRLLRYNNHICYVCNINPVFQSFRCPNCETFFNTTFSLKRKLTKCSEPFTNVYPRNVYQIRETLIDKLDSLGIKYTCQ